MEILENISIAKATTFKIGGKARYCLKPTSNIEFYNAIYFAKNKKLPYFILGQGSNVLVGSKDFNGVVILTTAMNSISINNNSITVGAGLSNTKMALFALVNKIKNFDFLYAMPGTIGGSTLMNARAFGKSMSDLVIQAKVIDQNMKWKNIPLTDIQYGYKTSIFQKINYNISEVTLKSEKGYKKEIKNKMKYNKKIRLQTKQYEYPSAGCIFKNNYKLGIPTGKIIDEIGLKGMTLGDLKISEHHANFIINKGNATSDQVISLIQYIKKEVKKKKNISIECEIKFLGNI